MSHSKDDQGVISVLVERLQTQRLPRALSLKEKVERGEVLDDLDITFLEQVISDTNSVQTILARHPEYQELVARMTHLYKEITDRALSNEKVVR